ncbi:MAG: DUF6152 family protein [Gammaproteobacteria bacterium]|nr:DUF6152 family protein [Gammaproteobacteria bacterium]MDH3507153.1 DUF6152 family protein [Gammaproteobacteria bacterium]
MRYSIVVAASTFGVASVALGHHSDAALDMDRVITIQGTVTEYSMRNPHTYFVVAVTNEAGETEEWNVQMASAITVSRRGWDRNTLQVGDEVVVGLRPARDGRPYGILSTVEVDGVSVSYSFARESGTPAQLATTDTIEGIWLTDRSRLPADYPGGLDQLMAARLTLTEKGRVMNEAYSQNDADNPELACMTKPTPGSIVYSRLYPLQIEILEEQQVIMMRSQFFDQERTVYMDGREHPPISERTHEGHSIGWWESDVLVVDTTNFADNRSPYQNGIPSGAQKHVVERYELLDGGTHMSVEFTLEDPEYIVGSMTDRRDLVYSPHVEFTPFNCDPEATRRYLPENRN